MMVVEEQELKNLQSSKSVWELATMERVTWSLLLLYSRQSGWWNFFQKFSPVICWKLAQKTTTSGSRTLVNCHYYYTTTTIWSYMDFFHEPPSTPKIFLVFGGFLKLTPSQKTIKCNALKTLTDLSLPNLVIPSLYGRNCQFYHAQKNNSFSFEN